MGRHDLYWMATARRRYRLEMSSGTAHRMSFRAWALRTYNEIGCRGKLSVLVAAGRS